MSREIFVVNDATGMSCLFDVGGIFFMSADDQLNILSVNHVALPLCKDDSALMNFSRFKMAHSGDNYYYSDNTEGASEYLLDLYALQYILPTSMHSLCVSFGICGDTNDLLVRYDNINKLKADMASLWAAWEKS